VLVAGATDAGKSSVAWSLLWALALGVRVGLVQVVGIDPKDGMELGRAPRAFHRLVSATASRPSNCWSRLPR
jgi:DNA segregation ATPase FtsK/SpoIIIE, S-DNA-T family